MQPQGERKRHKTWKQWLLRRCCGVLSPAAGGAVQLSPPLHIPLQPAVPQHQRANPCPQHLSATWISLWTVQESVLNIQTTVWNQVTLSIRRGITPPLTYQEFCWKDDPPHTKTFKSKQVLSVKLRTCNCKPLPKVLQHGFLVGSLFWYYKTHFQHEKSLHKKWVG